MPEQSKPLTMGEATARVEAALLRFRAATAAPFSPRVAARLRDRADRLDAETDAARQRLLDSLD